MALGNQLAKPTKSRKSGVSASLAKAKKKIGAVEKLSVNSSEKLIENIVNAVNRPGIARDIVFRSPSSRTVYAYSALTSDPTKIVREDEKGTRVVGSFRNGKFKALAFRGHQGD